MRLIFLLVLFTLLSFTPKKPLIPGSARAKWISETKIQLILKENLNINSVTKFALVNEYRKIELPLLVTTGFDRRVELEVKELTQSELSALISGDLNLIAINEQGEVVDSTGVQLAGLLDKRFFYAGNDLGPDFRAENIYLNLWAPTAISVQVYLYKNSLSDKSNNGPDFIINANKDNLGVWRAEINNGYNRYFYLYNVTVYNPSTKEVETNLVTDPYSKSLSINSKKSQLVNVFDESLMPTGWKNLQKKKTRNKIIYETHLRDLTAKDIFLKEEERGTYVGLSNPKSLAYQHLKGLAESGLSYIHFLPLNDFASVNEDRKKWQLIDVDIVAPSNSDRPQIELNRTRHGDGYNWGYDPFHYFVPEGSYSKNPDGEKRIKELREMIFSLNQLGLKVIVDVVFNHTYSSGSDSFSVLNKIVPLYYYRLNDVGDIHNSSCCSDTAAENKMMEKLMIDAVTFWAKAYKVDGFRFDLMSFHTRENMLNVKSSLLKLTIPNDGVDGSNLYLYGEGWIFGSLVEKNSKIAFSQENAYGAGIGFFNDRMRDAVRGGTTDSHEKSDQGFVTGLYFDYNNEIANRNTPSNLDDQRKKLDHLSDVIKIGLAGNLRDYRFKNHVGDYVMSKDYYFRSASVGYAATTDETINYVSAHDGHALFDAVSAKAPFYTWGRNPGIATLEEKQRIQSLALSFAMFSQGVPFFEGGSEILRSKSGDVDSYDSGDWYNALDFTFNENNWGKGLPPSFKNFNDWSFWSPRLSDSAMLIKKQNIEQSLLMFKSYLKIRSTSTLFHPKSLSETQASVSFIDNQKGQESGLIAMKLKNATEEMLIVFNVNKFGRNFKNEELNESFKLHPALNESIDPYLKYFSIKKGELSIPGRTVIVLVKDN